MIKYKYRKNNDDVFLRTVFAGLSEALTNVISYEQIEDDQTKSTIKVPIYLRATGQERFLQFYFNDKNYRVCEDEKTVEGSFDVIPRGVLSLSSGGIISSDKTSSFAQGDIHEVDENGYVKSYTGTIMAVPINVTLSLEILTNNLGEQFKVWQNLIKTLYFSFKFNIFFDGVIIPCEVSFPDNIENNKNFDFKNLDLMDNHIIKLGLDVETSLPVISNKMFKGNRIEKFQVNNIITPDQEQIEIYHSGSIQGRLTEYLTENPILGTIFLRNENDPDFEVEATLNDGYFLFEDIQARTGYKLVDSSGYTIKKKIHIFPGDRIIINEELDLS